MKNILIFGVNGYLGGLAASALYLDGWQVDGVGTTKKVDEKLLNSVENYFQIKSRISETNITLSDYSHIYFVYH